MRLIGRAGLPTFSRPNALQQFVFVNGRAVRDKNLSGALRAAYLDFLPSDRHAVVALFVSCDPSEVDVNVHPAKAEVRFRDSGLVRGLVVGAIKQRLAEALHRATATGGTATVLAMRPPQSFRPAAPPAGWDWRDSPAAPNLAGGFAEPAQARFAAFAPAAPAPAADAIERDPAAPLGAARAQVHGNYIIAQTADGLVIVDQHAAHERIVYERLKRQREGEGVERQALLTPLVVDLDPNAAALIDAHAEELASLGLVVEGFGPGAVLVREAPAVIAKGDLGGLVQRPRRRPRRRGRGAEPRPPARSLAGDFRLPPFGALGPPPEARGDERAPSRHGDDARRRPVQPRPADLCGIKAFRHRAAVRAAVSEGRKGSYRRETAVSVSRRKYL